MHTLSACKSSLEHLLRTREHDREIKKYRTAIRPPPLLLSALGSADRLARLKVLYDKARPRRSRGAPGILTTEEVFRENARRDGYADEEIAMFIDGLDLWSDA